MDIFEIIYLSTNLILLVDFLRNHGLIANNPICIICREALHVQQYSRVAIQYIWRCPRCLTRTTLFRNSFFSQVRIPPKFWVPLIYFWSAEVGIASTAATLGISRQAVGQFYQFLRDICSWYLIQNPVMLGGPGIIIEADESSFTKAKYNIGHQLARPQQWVFGAYDPAAKIGYLQLVQRRNGPTLKGIIAQRIALGTKMYTDEWHGYLGLNQMGYQHFTVNHQHHFVDPVTGATTNHVEAYWSRAKRKFKQMYGCHGGQELLASYLDEFMRRNRFAQAHHPAVAFQNILAHISMRYNVGGIPLNPGYDRNLLSY